MSSITSMQLQDIRCFAGRQQVRFGRKATVIVGENSTGKSTLLGCYRALVRLCSDPLLRKDGLDYFDSRPFEMGGFATIARKGSKRFALGGNFAGHWYNGLELEFKPESRTSSIPVDDRMVLSLESPNSKSNDFIVACPSGRSGQWTFEWLGLQFKATVSFHQPSTWLFNYVSQGELPYGGNPQEFAKQNKQASLADRENFHRLAYLLKERPRPPSGDAFSTVALYPEAKPRERLYASLPSSITEDKAMWDHLGNLGRKLGLFSSFSVREGREGSQLFIEQGGSKHNIVDVGYGIHSVLPLLMATYNKPPGTTFLLQQPEAHLHPQAQALLAQMMADQDGHRYIIETHSDYFINRFRICIKQGTLQPEDVSLVYCEPSDKSGNAVQIHNISFDEVGNLQGHPRSYRQFFMQETNRLLGFSE